MEVGVHVISWANSGPLSALRVAHFLSGKIQISGQQRPFVGSVMEVFGW